MNRIAKYAVVIAIVAIVASILLPRKAHGIVATAVQVVNSLVPVNTESAKTPFQATIPVGDTLQVPEGQRLVIENASGSCALGSYQSFFSMLFTVSTTASGVTATNVLAPVYQGAGQGADDALPFYFFVYNNPMKAYADPGSMVYFKAQGYPAQYEYGGTCYVVLSGYLINP
jgi:hypothetical protein